MSNVLRIHSPIIHPQTANLLYSQPDFVHCNRYFSNSIFKIFRSAPNYVLHSGKTNVIRWNIKSLTNYSEEGSTQGIDSSPVSIELEPISSEIQFDQVVAEAQQLGAVIILWMASWCRKCIYLKPKLEKLAAEYYPRIRFYCVNVNSVPHKLVVRAGVAKMPAIQLWKDNEKLGEVIGGHTAHLVVNEVRDMIEDHCST